MIRVWIAAAAWLLLAGVIAATAWTSRTTPASSGCRAQALDLLHFGLRMPHGHQVDAAMWDGFLADEVTPRFPDGFTALEARGQWRGAAGATVREPSRVLEIVHDGDDGANAAIDAVIERYKRRFAQESVLRLSLRGQACF